MYNRYIGNTGRYYRVDEAEQKPQPQTPPIDRAAAAQAAGAAPRGFLESILPSGLKLEMGDIILLLIVFLLYLDSKDEEFLIILAFLAFNILKRR
ncbi:MAG: hypothetical protein LBJ84_04955 [Oscillospiraceae bacterium]|jgi:hypothetical protein|nr:hypothetical protein [Oscillospiraceae bacterium]